MIRKHLSAPYSLLVLVHFQFLEVGELAIRPVEVSHRPREDRSDGNVETAEVVGGGGSFPFARG